MAHAPFDGTNAVLSELHRTWDDEMRAQPFLIAGSLMATALFAASADAGPPHFRVPDATTPEQIYADCIAARNRTGSDRFVRADPGSDEERKAAASLGRILPACAKRLSKGATELTGPMLRGLIAERLWVTTVSQLTGSTSSLDPNKIDFDQGFDATPALRDTYRLGRCVATIRPEGVDALIRTRPSSAEEKAAFEALRQPISSCVAKGRSVALARAFLRAVLAEQLYRLFPLPGLGLVWRPTRAAPQPPFTIPGRGGYEGQMQRPTSH